MSQSEENMFEKQWRNAFNEATDTPPMRVWDAIERQLNEEEHGAVVIPFWTRLRPFAYGAAAAVALILLGWWAFYEADRAGADSPGLARQESIPAPSGPASSEQVAAAEQTAADAAGRNPNSLSPEQPEASATPPAVRYDEAVAGRLRTNWKTPGTSSALQTPPRSESFADLPSTMSAVSPRSRTDFRSGESADHQPAIAAKTSETVQERFSRSDAAMATGALERREASYALLAGKPFSLRSRQGISRVVWFRMPDDLAAPQIDRKSRSKEYWTAVTVMPMSFNPAASVRVTGLTPVYATASPSMLSNQGVSTQPEIQNRARMSLSMQWNTGMKVSEHWSVETGVMYLQGNATAQSNAVVMTAMSSSADNLLETALKNSALGQDKQANFDPSRSNSLYAAATNSTTVANEFRFVQIPVQAGYHIRPAGKVSYALLGGILANVFLQNTVGTVEVTPDDAVYRPVTLSGTGGVRINYRPTRRWSGSVTGSYQYALQTGTRPEAQVQTRPQAMGIGVGMNYHF
ncbi:outer membrane beta-barrel protein [Tellurirhabdus rosea]|uniref:outer membrane beta-barrel protein n=1 Tax=Tellurirhabdus rosea TaxID=2674997 RepID=UPI0022571415|nr:hypothetical protein [Tellurirhabdus rosea]